MTEGSEWRPQTSPLCHWAVLSLFVLGAPPSTSGPLSIQPQGTHSTRVTLHWAHTATLLAGVEQSQASSDSPLLLSPGNKQQAPEQVIHTETALLKANYATASPLRLPGAPGGRQVQPEMRVSVPSDLSGL